MKLSVLTNLFGDISLEEALVKFEKLGIEAVEIGCGGYPGKAHCNPAELLADAAKYDAFMATLKKYDVTVWAHHGIFCSGENFDLTFGLAHTVEKSAEIYMKVRAASSEKVQTITKENFIDLAKAFGFTINEDFLK